MKGPTPAWRDTLETAARQRTAAAGVRARRALAPSQGACLTDGREHWVDFSGNDYLGLRGHPAIAAALAEGARRHGAGSGASALVTGYHPAHQALEESLAEYLEREAVLLFSSGYLANLAVATSLAGRGDCIVQDRLCHASLIDAARLSGARLARYPHSDLEAMARRLEPGGDGACLLVTDGLFSMDGDVAPLAGAAALARARDALFIVDDAHGIGVRGPGGRGSVAEAGLGADQVPVLVGTLGKAFACSGAFVAGSRALIEHLVNEARSYLFTTAPPPALARAGRAALACIQGEAWRRERLRERVAQFRDGARAAGIPLLDSDSAIQPVMIGDSGEALAISRELSGQGYLAVAIRPPTVPAGTARLRITLSAAHEAGQVRGLLEALDACLVNR